MIMRVTVKIKLLYLLLLDLGSTAVGSMSDCRSRGRKFESQSKIDHGIISTIILPTSTDSKRAVVSYW